jgi:hypothetical protein
MLAALAPATFGPDHELEDARESLAYWETRARTLPLTAIRGRREAREMTVRWQARVAEAERLVYGRGLLGALLLVASERRLPQQVRHRSHVVARRVLQATVAMVALLVALAVAGMWAVMWAMFELVSAILQALA